MFQKLGLKMKAFLLLGKLSFTNVQADVVKYVLTYVFSGMCYSSEKLELIASGRRGVFDGTVENMHLHWKYRELIKILVKAKSYEGAKSVAMALEAESGGILVSVDKISKGYAIIVYRGKDYQRPSEMRPKNLLTKRKALARSLELQRRQVC